MKEVRHRHIFVYISQNYHVFYVFWPKFANESQQKIHYQLKKGDFEPQYFTLRTIKKLGDLSIKNVLNIWPNLRLSVLINFVLTTKKKSVYTIRSLPKKSLYYYPRPDLFILCSHGYITKLTSCRYIQACSVSSHVDSYQISSIKHLLPKIPNTNIKF